jgi:hypothetical protein
LPSLKFYLSPVKIASLIGMILRLSDDLDETLRLDHPDIVTFEEQQEKYVTPPHTLADFLRSRILT